MVGNAMPGTPPSLTLPRKGGGKSKKSPSPSTGEEWGGGDFGFDGSGYWAEGGAVRCC